MAKLPQELIRKKGRVPGLAGDLVELLYGGDTPDPSDFIAPLGMARIPEAALHAAINARRKLYHGTIKPIKIMKQGIKSDEAFGNPVSLSRDPAVSSSFGHAVFEIDPNKLPRKSRPYQAEGFDKSDRMFEAEERIPNVPTKALDKLLLDENAINWMFEGNSPKGQRNVIEHLINIMNGAKELGIPVESLPSFKEILTLKARKR